ncbi:MAG: GNAT family N-acetyltransferase [Rhodomicrobium sp.]
MFGGARLFFTETRPYVEGDGVFLREPQMSDYAEWAAIRAESREFLEPWEPRWPRDELERDTYRRRTRYYYRDARQDLGYAFFLFRSSDSSLIGGMTLSNIRRGVSQSGSLGYWIGAPYARQGYMTRGVRAITWFVFDVLHLHRLEAACLPENTASAALLTRTGFQYEGLARRYLKINGTWQDHWLFALLAEDRTP